MLGYVEAASKMDHLLRAMRAHSLSGIQLKDDLEARVENAARETEDAVSS
jgi:hypothetical protein